MRRAPRLPLAALLAVSLSLSGCRSVGRAANGYLDFGGRTFTTNPVSVLPYFLGFVPFFVAGLPLDLITWIMASIAWDGTKDEDYRACALSPSYFLGTTGGILLGAPFFPFGLPWWDPEREDDEAPKSQPKALPADQETKAPPADVPPPTRDAAPARGRSADDVPAGAPGR